MKLDKIFTSPLLYVIITLVCYLLADFIYKKIKLHYILPILISMAMLIAVLTVSGITHSEYMSGGSVIAFFLGPATVSLAVPLFRQMKLFNRKKSVIILVGITSGVITALVSVLVLSKITGLSDVIIRSLYGKSVTMPIALGICESAEGIAYVTISGVIVAGILGAVAAPLIFKLVKIKHPVAKGAALGTASHIIGTVRAFEIGEKEGSVSSISIGIAGVITAFIVPLFLCFL